MATILIVESNSPETVASGHAASVSFVRFVLATVPANQLRIAAPYSCHINECVFEGVDGVVFTGSGVNWSTDAPEAQPLRDAMLTAFDTGLPCWGSCNGLQLASVVLGGSVRASPNGMEVGVAQDLTLTDTGAKHPMMLGRTNGFSVPCIHRDEVQQLPEGAVLLAGNTHSPVQAMVYEKGGVDFWGTQYHPELTTRDIAFGVRQDGIFKGHSSAVDLDRAEADEQSAKRLGSSVEDLKPSNRARELINWLDHVSALKSS